MVYDLITIKYYILFVYIVISCIFVQVITIINTQIYEYFRIDITENRKRQSV